MKPTAHIVKIIESVSADAPKQHGRERQIISLQQYTAPMSFLLYEGTAAMYRGQDHLLITNLHAPSIIGLNFFITSSPDIYFQARGPITFALVPIATIAESVHKQNLWESLAYTNMHMTRLMIENHFQSTGIPTYDLVRNNLLALMEEPEELRMKTNACDYIQEKTLLSRSGIMKMLGDLKKGGHIDLKRGVLLDIIKLPLKY